MFSRKPMGTTNAPCRFFLGADVGDFLEHVVTRRDVTRPKTVAVGAVAMTVHLLVLQPMLR
jgi:hypothetical protein